MQQVARLEESLTPPGARICECTSAPSNQPANSTSRQSEAEPFVLHLALPDVGFIPEASRRIALRLSSVALPRLDRVILFCTLLI